MDWIRGPLQITKEDIQAPFEKLSGSIRTTYRYMNEAGAAFSSRRFLGMKDEQHGRFHHLVPAYEPKEVDERTGFGRVGRLAESVIDVTVALAETCGICAPHFQDKTAQQAGLALAQGLFFDASLLERTSTPFRFFGGKLQTPNGEWDRHNRRGLTEEPWNDYWGPWNYSLTEDTLRKAWATVTLPFGRTEDSLSLRELFFIWPLHTTHIHSGFSNIANKEGRIWTFPSFYYRSPDSFRAFAAYKSFGDPMQQALAARRAWTSMDGVLAQAQPTFADLEKRLPQMPLALLASYWPEDAEANKGHATAVQKARLAQQFQVRYSWNRQAPESVNAAPPSDYGQIDWTTYRLANAFEHIGLSLREAPFIAPDAPVKAQKEKALVRAFLAAARAYGEGMVAETERYCAESKAAEAELRDHAAKGLWKKLSTKEPKVSYSNRLMQLFLGPEVFAQPPYTSLKPAFLAATAALFTAQGREVPWSQQALERLRFERMSRPLTP